MRKIVTARGVVCAAVVALGAIAIPVGAQTTTNYSVGAACSGGGQLCNSLATINVTTTGLLEANFVAASGLCSNIRIHYFVDTLAGPVTGFVGASASTGLFDLGPVSAEATPSVCRRKDKRVVAIPGHSARGAVPRR